jgi:hypothetical protein
LAAQQRPVPAATRLWTHRKADHRSCGTSRLASASKERSAVVYCGRLPPRPRIGLVTQDDLKQPLTTATDEEANNNHHRAGTAHISTSDPAHKRAWAAGIRAGSGLACSRTTRDRTRSSRRLASSDRTLAQTRVRSARCSEPRLSQPSVPCTTGVLLPAGTPPSWVRRSSTGSLWGAKIRSAWICRRILLGCVGNTNARGRKRASLLDGTRAGSRVRGAGDRSGRRQWSPQPTSAWRVSNQATRTARFTLNQTLRMVVRRGMVS